MHADLDPHAILQALGYADEVSSITPISGGWDTALWRVARRERTYALRVFRAEQASICRREAAVMRAGLPGIPIPRVHAEGVWHDRPALLLEWCNGTTLLAAIQKDPTQAPALAAAFGRTQAALHAAPVPTALHAPRDAWMTWQGGGDAALSERLQAIAAPQESVLHFDYHPLNVLVDNGTVSAVLDWANVQVGDRRADLARTATILRLAPFPPDLPPLLVQLVSRVVLRAWRRGYRSVAGPTTGMAPFYAWAGEVMLNDLTPKLGQPGNWLQLQHLEPVHRWVAYWRQRAGVVA